MHSTNYLQKYTMNPLPPLLQVLTSRALILILAASFFLLLFVLPEVSAYQPCSICGDHHAVADLDGLFDGLVPYNNDRHRCGITEDLGRQGLLEQEGKEDFTRLILEPFWVTMTALIGLIASAFALIQTTIPAMSVAQTGSCRGRWIPSIHFQKILPRISINIWTNIPVKVYKMEMDSTTIALIIWGPIGGPWNIRLKW